MLLKGAFCNWWREKDKKNLLSQNEKDTLSY
jgi:hypothetical protein